MQARSLAHLLACAALSFSCAAAHAHEYYTGTMTIVHPWTEPTGPGVTSTKVYARFDQITVDDKLIGARSEFAGSIELRGPKDVRVDAIALPAGTDVRLKPDGNYLMMLNLKTTLFWNRSYPLTLIFENAGAIDTMMSMSGTND